MTGNGETVLDQMLLATFLPNDLKARPPKNEQYSTIQPYSEGKMIQRPENKHP